MVSNCGVGEDLRVLGLHGIQPVHPKGNQSWIFIGRSNTKAETPILWPPEAKNWLIGKDPNAGKDWRWEEKGTTENEMVGWHHPLSGQEFEQTPGDGEGQGSLASCSPWCCKELDTTEQLNKSSHLHSEENPPKKRVYQRSLLDGVSPESYRILLTLKFHIY